MTEWTELSARASIASHRLIGWVYWDPLGIDNGFGYYLASRGAPLAPAGYQAVTAAFSSIHPVFVEAAITAAAADSL